MPIPAGFVRFAHAWEIIQDAFPQLEGMHDTEWTETSCKIELQLPFHRQWIFLRIRLRDYDGPFYWPTRLRFTPMLGAAVMNVLVDARSLHMTREKPFPIIDPPKQSDTWIHKDEAVILLQKCYPENQFIGCQYVRVPGSCTLQLRWKVDGEVREYNFIHSLSKDCVFSCPRVQFITCLHRSKKGCSCS